MAAYADWTFGGTMRITGTIRYVELEGGFWGIAGDDGVNYYPVDGLPSTLQKDGCRISTEIEPANVVSFAMWGRNVRLINPRTA
jgi:hypothetical protein